MRPPALLFGVPVDDVTMQETLDRIGEFVRLGRLHGRTYQVSTVNVDFLVNALDDPGVASILQNADLCLADGMPVVWGARLLGMAVRERVAGSDLVPLLIEATQKTGRRVHVFGSSPEVADAARTLLRDRYPDATFSIDPGPLISDPDHVDDSVIESIVEVDPDVLCVALGNPKQERFIRANRDRLGTPVMIGVGGSLDMLVGKRKRAPRWVQTIGMEWVVRAAQEPKRLGRRYAHVFRVFGPALARLWRASRRRRRSSALHLDISPDEVRAELHGAEMPRPSDWQQAAKTIADGATLRVSANEPGSDPAVAQILGLVRIARHYGVDVVAVAGTSDAAAAQLRAQHVSSTMLGLDH